MIDKRGKETVFELLTPDCRSLQELSLKQFTVTCTDKLAKTGW